MRRNLHNTFPDSSWRNMAALSYGMYDGRNEKIFKQLSIKNRRVINAGFWG